MASVDYSSVGVIRLFGFWVYVLAKNNHKSSLKPVSSPAAIVETGLETGFKLF